MDPSQFEVSNNFVNVHRLFLMTDVYFSFGSPVERVPDGQWVTSLSAFPGSVQPRAGSVRISVTDSGAGLSEAQLAKICSEGVQFNANELQAGKGSGLGLFITKGIVEQHGGKLTVTSDGIGAGTTFTVELPLFESLQDSVIAHGATHTSVNKDLPLSAAVVPADHAERAPRRILVVDDVMSNRKMLIRLLTSSGYVCEQAEDGQQAIDKYLSSLRTGNTIDAITMDFEMPVMDGPTATKKLREIGCQVPIIGVTGNMLTADVEYFRAQGATVVLGKPLNMARFQENIQRLL